MWNSKKSVYLSITVCFMLSFVLLMLVFFGPTIFSLYLTSYRGFKPDGDALEMLMRVFGFTFYPSSIFAAIILYSLIKLLFNIKSGKIFITSNVTYLRVVSLSCFIIGLITLIATFFYMPFLFVTFAGFFVGTLLRVLKNVMQNAVEISEENDLTI